MRLSWWSRIAIAQIWLAVGVGSVGEATLLTAALLNRAPAPAPAVAALPDGESAVEEVGIGHPVSSFDPTDDRALAAFATDIFLGRVVAQTGDVGAPTTAPGQELPMTQFSVQVLRVVKGHARGMVTVNQVGGQDEDVLVTRADGRRERVTRKFLLEGDRLLVPGQRALFVTVHVPAARWYQLVSAGESHPPAATKAQEDQLVGRFARAADRARRDQEGAQDAD